VDLLWAAGTGQAGRGSPQELLTRPLRYGGSRRFETIPSRPILHACSKIIGPSSSMFSESRTPCSAQAAFRAVPSGLEEGGHGSPRRSVVGLGGRHGPTNPTGSNGGLRGVLHSMGLACRISGDAATTSWTHLTADKTRDRALITRRPHAGFAAM
jgi:hypothetical protein